MATSCRSCKQHTDYKRKRPRGPWDGSVATTTPQSTLVDAAKFVSALRVVSAVPLEAAGAYFLDMPNEST